MAKSQPNATIISSMEELLQKLREQGDVSPELLEQLAAKAKSGENKQAIKRKIREVVERHSGDVVWELAFLTKICGLIREKFGFTPEDVLQGDEIESLDFSGLDQKDLVTVLESCLKSPNFKHQRQRQKKNEEEVADQPTSTDAPF